LMCGIAGWIDWQEKVEKHQEILEAMSATLARRGPDDDGMWVSSPAAIIHRRLIVVDPAGGRQPMVRRRAGKSFVITYNGELYNTDELRRELQQLGYTFQGHSDTDVLLSSYMEWGENCLEKLNGIFAFGIWDEANQTLFLARDRLGVKPLFYARRGSAFIFGSEIKTVLAHPSVNPVVDADGLAEIFVMGPARTPGQGVFKEIRELRPGFCLTYDRRGLRIRQYWQLVSHTHIDDLDTTAAHLQQLVRDTVERQLVSDVPICVLLSGGLDSSVITAFAAMAFDRLGSGVPLHTYSVDYRDSDHYFQANDYETNADGPWVEKVSDHFGTTHHRILIDTPELAEALRTALYARDLPGMTDIDSSLYLFCHEVKKEATVALSGEAADETFGGYPWFHREDSLNCGTFPWIRMVPRRMQLLSPDLCQAMRPQEYLAQRYQEVMDEVPRLPGEERYEAKMRECRYLSMTRFMPILLDRKDRMSMYTGLEVRVPFCDHRLVQYVWNIPWSMITCDGLSKGILRRTVTGVLPEEARLRRKSPYPKTHHPAYLQAVQELALDVLNDPGSPLRPLLNMSQLRPLIESGAAEFQSSPWFSQLMGAPQLMAYLAQVDMWLRHYRVSICC
jgi:asparagine synthase (glutamine-hydrolysing)